MADSSCWIRLGAPELVLEPDVPCEGVVVPVDCVEPEPSESPSESVTPTVCGAVVDVLGALVSDCKYW